MSARQKWATDIHVCFYVISLFFMTMIYEKMAWQAFISLHLN